MFSPLHIISPLRHFYPFTFLSRSTFLSLSLCPALGRTSTCWFVGRRRGWPRQARPRWRGGRRVGGNDRLGRAGPRHRNAAPAGGGTDLDLFGEALASAPQEHDDEVSHRRR